MVFLINCIKIELEVEASDYILEVRNQLYQKLDRHNW
jgi:hypothetical protein